MNVTRVKYSGNCTYIGNVRKFGTFKMDIRQDMVPF